MQFHTRSEKILIKVNAIIPEDADDYLGADIEDHDAKAGTALLYVHPYEIDASFDESTDIIETEAWGQVQCDEIYYLDVHWCKWKDHPIINDEDVCYEISNH